MADSSLFPASFEHKTCRECDEVKPLAAFYPHPMMRDGHLNKCKECVKARVRQHRRRNRDSIRAYDRERAKLPHRREHARRVSAAWLRDNPHKAREFREKYPEKYRAHIAVSNAIRDGKLARQPCEVCGTTRRVHAHHDDYSKPLEVRWLCPQHHSDAHGGFGPGRR